MIMENRERDTAVVWVKGVSGVQIPVSCEKSVREWIIKHLSEGKDITGNRQWKEVWEEFTGKFPVTEPVPSPGIHP